MITHKNESIAYCVENISIEVLFIFRTVQQQNASVNMHVRWQQRDGGRRRRTKNKQINFDCARLKRK